eukprot:scaffold1605_cov242-Pinguiococcus_pyrenoidosus.AAC.4
MDPRSPSRMSRSSCLETSLSISCSEWVGGTLAFGLALSFGFHRGRATDWALPLTLVCLPVPGPDATVTILGATSGDTGPAAIHGLRGKKGVDCFILYPKGRTSPLQERQMTTVLDRNVHCIGVHGSFDDAQAIVKAAFADDAFRDEVKLGAINSINWARVLAQMSYYFWAWLSVTKPGDALR